MFRGKIRLWSHRNDLGIEGQILATNSDGPEKNFRICGSHSQATTDRTRNLPSEVMANVYKYLGR